MIYYTWLYVWLNLVIRLIVVLWHCWSYLTPHPNLFLLFGLNFSDHWFRDPCETTKVDLSCYYIHYFDLFWPMCDNKWMFNYVWMFQIVQKNPRPKHNKLVVLRPSFSTNNMKHLILWESSLFKIFSKYFSLHCGRYSEIHKLALLKKLH